MKSERVDFSTVREDYNVYKVENGQILKVKSVILDLVNETDGNGKPNAKIKLQTTSVVITPQGLDTTGLIDDENVTEADHVKELKFEVVTDGMINIYETKKSLILTGSKVEKVFATTKKNRLNEPILRFNALNAVNVVEKPDFVHKDDVPFLKN